MRRSWGLLLLLICATALLSTACSSGSSSAGSSTTSFAPLTVPNSSSTTQPMNPSTTVSTTPGSDRPDTRPQAILDAAVLSVSDRCTDGLGTITVSHPIIGGGDELLTAIVDGRQVSERLSDPGSRLQIEGIRCDGAAHTVLLVITGADGSSVTRARAVLMP